MSVFWSHFEVCWETPTCYLNRFFDSRISMKEYAERLAKESFTLFVETLEHESPHHGPTIRKVIKSTPKSSIAQRRTPAP